MSDRLRDDMGANEQKLINERNCLAEALSFSTARSAILQSQVDALKSVRNVLLVMLVGVAGQFVIAYMGQSTAADRARLEERADTQVRLEEMLSRLNTCQGTVAGYKTALDLYEDVAKTLVNDCKQDSHGLVFEGTAWQSDTANWHVTTKISYPPCAKAESGQICTTPNDERGYRSGEMWFSMEGSSSGTIDGASKVKVNPPTQFYINQPAFTFSSSDPPDAGAQVFDLSKTVVW